MSTVCPSCGMVPDNPVSAWLAERLKARLEHREPRCWGISSDALAAYAVGIGDRPTIPGRPYQQSAGGGRWAPEEAGRNYPHDLSDLNACERTFAMAPGSMRFRMKPVLEEFRAYVLDGLDRYGEPAHLGRAWGRRGWTPWESIDIDAVMQDA